MDATDAPAPVPGSPDFDVNAFLERQVPITRAMGIRFESFDAGGVRMSAPLEPNVNDKGIAFGGSLVSVMALACWSCADLLLRRQGIAAEVFVASADVEFRLPVRGRIEARCPLPAAEEVERFLAAFRSRGRAGLRLEATVAAGEGVAALFRGRYTARRQAAR